MQKPAQSPDTFEVVIVGGGMVGASLACLLGEAGIEVALLDARSGPLDAESVGVGKPAQRVSALTPVSQRLLEGLGAWPWMQGRRVSPYRFMQVWDGEGSGEVNFSADQARVSVLGHIVENDVILAGLETRLVSLPSVHQRFDARVIALEGGEDERIVRLENGERLATPLVVAADGAQSPLRDLAGIDVRSRETGHSALVTTVRTQRPHRAVARQVFWPTGPLAFLPLLVDDAEHHCSIVWSTSPREAERLAALSAEALGAEMGAALEHRLGEVEVIDRAVTVALTQRHAENYSMPGLALVGDAAHSIHPLAGQGVNLGLMDAAVLAEELARAHRRGVPLGDTRVLSQYARRRRGDNAAMLALMDAFQRLFGARHPAISLARNLGLSGVDRLVPVKRLLMQQAIGHRGRLPVSCR